MPLPMPSRVGSAAGLVRGFDLKLIWTVNFTGFKKNPRRHEFRLGGSPVVSQPKIEKPDAH
jgi:hypothetical protein